MYRDIRIRFVDEDELIGIVEGWRDLFQARDCAIYVRRLSIVKKKPGEDDREATWPAEAWPQDRTDDPFPRVDLAWPLERDDEFWTLSESISFDPCLPRLENASKQEAWSLLARLVPNLPGLRDVVYRSDE